MAGRRQARRGQLVDVLEGGPSSSRVAVVDHTPAGLITWLIAEDGTTAEIRVLVVAAELRGRGVGRALLEAACAALSDAGAETAWVVTTNDNLAALALYQRAGFRLSALRAGAIDGVRASLKPEIPELGEHGIPLRDELELERRLPSPTRA